MADKEITNEEEKMRRQRQHHRFLKIASVKRQDRKANAAKSSNVDVEDVVDEMVKSKK